MSGSPTEHVKFPTHFHHCVAQYWCFHFTLYGEHAVISAEMCCMLLPVKDMLHSTCYSLKIALFSQHKMDILILGLQHRKSAGKAFFGVAA